MPQPPYGPIPLPFKLEARCSASAVRGDCLFRRDSIGFCHCGDFYPVDEATGLRIIGHIWGAWQSTKRPRWAVPVYPEQCANYQPQHGTSWWRERATTDELFEPPPVADLVRALKALPEPE